MSMKTGLMDRTPFGPSEMARITKYLICCGSISYPYSINKIYTPNNWMNLSVAIALYFNELTSTVFRCLYIYILKWTNLSNT